jgi:hypothetical protein
VSFDERTRFDDEIAVSAGAMRHNAFLSGAAAG